MCWNRPLQVLTAQSLVETLDCILCALLPASQVQLLLLLLLNTEYEAVLSMYIACVSLYNLFTN